MSILEPPRSILRLALVGALLVTASAWNGEPPPRYTIESLGEVRALAMNDSGWIAGSDAQPTRQRPFVVIRGNRYDIRGLGERGGHPLALSAGGVVVGTSLATLSSPFAFAWRAGRTTRLTAPQGVLASAVHDVNGRGDMVGGGHAGEREVALVWSGESVRILPAPDGGSATATAINDSGWIVGHAEAGNRRHAVLWRDGIPEELGLSAAFAAIPTDVNDRGQVVVSTRSATGAMRAFLWENGEAAELGPGEQAEARAINDAGQVVGFVAWRTNLTQAVIWEGGRTVYLERLLPRGHGWTLLTAHAINERGWIVGQGRRAGRYEAWLMKPVP